MTTLATVRPMATRPCPPPTPYAVLVALAAARLDAPRILPESFAAPCDECGRARLSTTSALCPECEP